MTPLLDRQALAALPGAPADQRVVYGSAPSQFVDLYLPPRPLLPGTGARAPVVMLLHGGCWRARVGLDYFGQTAQALAAQGVAAVNVEYRRLGEGGGWPSTFEDVARALALLPSLAEAHALELSRLVLVGHSAGGQLALWLAARHRLPREHPLFAPPSSLRAVVTLAGLLDLQGAAVGGLCQGAPQALLGGEPDALPERYAWASPAALLPIGCPQVLIQGRDDAVVPLAYARGYARQAQAHGETLRIRILAACGHFEPVVPGTTAWRTVLEEVMKELGRQTRYAESASGNA